MLSFKKLLPIYAVIFFGYLGYSLFVTIFTPMFLYSDGVLPSDLAQSYRILILGFVLFLYPFGQFLSSPILGALTDRFGRRPILLLSLIVSTSMYALMGVAIWLKSLLLLICALFISGLSEGNLTIGQSAIADVIPKEKRCTFFGYVQFSSSLSYVAGPLLGGFLANREFDSLFGFELPFFAVSILLFITLLWLYFGFDETLSLQKREKIPYLKAFTNIKNLFAYRQIRFFFFVNFLLYLAIFGFFQSFPIFIVHYFKVDVEKLALLIAWGDIPSLIVNLFIIRILARYFTPIKVTMVTAILSGIFLLIFWIPFSMRDLWPILIVVGFPVALALSYSAIMISFLASEKEQGRVLGINQSLQFLGEAISGLIVGLLASILVKLSLLVFALLSLIAGILLLVWGRRGATSPQI